MVYQEITGLMCLNFVLYYYNILLRKIEKFIKKMITMMMWKIVIEKNIIKLIF